MRIELLYFDGCPSYERLLPRLQGIPPDELVLRALDEHGDDAGR